MAQFHCMEMNWSSLLALVLLAYFAVSMLFTGVFLLLAVRLQFDLSLTSIEDLPHPSDMLSEGNMRRDAEC